MKLLIAEDEPGLLNFLMRGLKAEGFDVSAVSELHNLPAIAKREAPEVIILDRMFGEQDSLAVIETLKRLSPTPMILLLTALDEVAERVKGLQQGADDYLCKPFDFDELLARITALARRKGPGVHSTERIITLGNLVLRAEQRVCLLKEEEIPLTKLEYDLLLYFAENPYKVLSRERILSRVWQSHADPLTNVVDVYVSRLRKKLERDTHLVIETLRGNGYRMSLL